MFRHERNLQNQNRSRALNMIETHPPQRTLVDDSEIRLMGDEGENGAGGGHAAAGGFEVDGGGVCALLDDAVVEGAEARAVDDDAGAVEEHGDGDADGFAFGSLACGIGLKGDGEVGVPVGELVVELADGGL